MIIYKYNQISFPVLVMYVQFVFQNRHVQLTPLVIFCLLLGSLSKMGLLLKTNILCYMEHTPSHYLFYDPVMSLPKWDGVFPLKN